MKKGIKVIITGGGTAGHVMPALAVAEVLKKQNCEILYIGSKKGIEAKLVLKYNLPFKTIICGKLRRYWSLRNFIDPVKIILGIIQSLWYIARFQPKVVFSKGGYVGFPVVVASWILRKPIIIHESDLTLGLANRLSLPLAKRLAVSFPVENYPHLPAKKIIYTGNPLRKIFLPNISESKIYFQLKENLPVLLIMGGSQGAHRINQTIQSVLPELLSHVQIIHITGPYDFKCFKSIKEELPSLLKVNYHVYDFLADKIFSAMAVADLIINRAGANSLFETAFFGKPLILIPLPGHQEKNAEFFAQHKAAYMIKNNELTPQILLKNINHLLENSKERKILSKNLSSFVIPEAAEIISQEIIKLALK